MLLFALERGLLRLSANTPAFAPLFQFPPRIGRRFLTRTPIAVTGNCFDPAAQHAPQLIVEL